MTVFEQVFIVSAFLYQILLLLNFLSRNLRPELELKIRMDYIRPDHTGPPGGGSLSPFRTTLVLRFGVLYVYIMGGVRFLHRYLPKN